VSIDAISLRRGSNHKNGVHQSDKSGRFEKVKVVSEDTYPLDLFLDDPTTKSIMADLQITSEQAKDFGFHCECKGTRIETI